MVGTPDEAIAKILAQQEVFGHQRYLPQMAVGAQPQPAILRSIELLGTIVAPAVWAAPAKRNSRAKQIPVGWPTDRLRELSGFGGDESPIRWPSRDSLP